MALPMVRVSIVGMLAPCSPLPSTVDMTYHPLTLACGGVEL